MLVKRLVQPWRWRPRRTETWALRDLDLQIERGETVGVIGRNGSGKTTLLRLLSGVSAPTTGRLRVAGSIAPLIGVGVGFHPELTGRENVFVNGRLLGMSERQLRDRYDAIVDFSEIGDAIDMPVKYYSSGMFLRLGFSVAIHTDPEILLVDEILAVGDIAFQLKCLERMREVQARGTTIVVVTHNLHSLDQIAPRTVVLQPRPQDVRRRHRGRARHLPRGDAGGVEAGRLRRPSAAGGPHVHRRRRARSAAARRDRRRRPSRLPPASS